MSSIDLDAVEAAITSKQWETPGHDGFLLNLIERVRTAELSEQARKERTRQMQARKARKEAAGDTTSPGTPGLEAMHRNQCHDGSTDPDCWECSLITRTHTLQQRNQEQRDGLMKVLEACAPLGMATDGGAHRPAQQAAEAVRRMQRAETIVANVRAVLERPRPMTGETYRFTGGYATELDALADLYSDEFVADLRRALDDTDTDTDH